MTEELYKKFKGIVSEHIKENGLSQRSINDVLLAMHITTAELFKVLEDYKPKKEAMR